MFRKRHRKWRKTKDTNKNITDAHDNVLRKHYFMCHGHGAERLSENDIEIKTENCSQHKNHWTIVEIFCDGFSRTEKDGKKVFSSSFGFLLKRACPLFPYSPSFCKQPLHARQTFNAFLFSALSISLSAPNKTLKICTQIEKAKNAMECVQRKCKCK